MDQDLIAYLDRRFSSLDERFATIDERFSALDGRVEHQIQALREETAQGFARIDQRLGGVDQRLETLGTDIRRAYVSIEGLRGDVRLVAEGVTNVNERLDRYKEEASRRVNDLESLLQRSYEDLDFRVRKVEKAG